MSGKYRPHVARSYDSDLHLFSCFVPVAVALYWAEYYNARFLDEETIVVDSMKIPYPNKTEGRS
jgi:hypothetical protein